MYPMHPFALIAVTFYLLLIGLHILLAISVYKDAALREHDAGRLMFIGPRAWGIAALVCGIVGLLVYWLIHDSMLARNDVTT